MDKQYEEIFLLPLDLQIFADESTGEKTESATPRKREEARQKGQVFKSTDLNSAVILLAGSVVLFVTFPYMVNLLKEFTTMYILDRTLSSFSNQYAYELLIEVLLLLGKILFPVLLTTFITALVITYLQVGFVFSSEPLNFKLERLNPLEGFKKIFSKRALVELTKSLLKVSVTGYIVYTVFRKYLYVFPRFVDMELAATLIALTTIVFEIALKVGVFFIIVGVLDYIYQWYEHEKSLKMSKYDIKQEYKQIEGDPYIKSRQRQIQREAAMRRMMTEVPKADVVITNPTHFAVALKYDADTMEAPTVVAKGQDLIALKIREIAELNKVVIVENPLLARTLYYALDIGTEVPEDLYQAIAEVLAFVYKQKQLAM